MAKIKIKALSVNQVWAGRRFKTPKYKAYEEELGYLLPKMKVPEGKLEVNLRFGFANKMSDIDNCLKPFLDILQKKYGFNDNKIYRLVVDKEIIKKGEEFISFNIKNI